MNLLFVLVNAVSLTGTDVREHPFFAIGRIEKFIVEHPRAKLVNRICGRLSDDLRVVQLAHNRLKNKTLIDVLTFFRTGKIFIPRKLQCHIFKKKIVDFFK